MGYTITNRKVNLMGISNVVIGDITLSDTAQVLVTGLRVVEFFMVSSAGGPGGNGVLIVYNSNDGTEDTAPGSMWIDSEVNSVDGKFMAIGI